MLAKQETKQRVAGILILLAILLAGARAQGVVGHQQQPDVMRIVSAFLERAHLTDQPLDDALSRRAFKTWIHSLDPPKLYFYQSDVDEFARSADKLDDYLKEGKSALALGVYARFVQRVGERVALAEQIMSSPLDFEVVEELVTDPELVRYPRTELEARDRWRRRIKSDLLALEADKVTGTEARDRLRRRYERFKKRVGEEREDEIVSRFINAVATTYDPHTIYMAPKPYEDFSINVTLNYQGIGALLGEEDDYVIIRRIIPGGAAEKHGGLKAKDRIVSIGQGADGPLVDTVGVRMDDVVKLIRGKEGTVVRLGVIPTGGGATRIHTLVRARIELEESTAKGEVLEHGMAPSGQPLKIGFIDLPSFYRDSEGEREGRPEFRSSARDVKRLLEEFKGQGVDAVILDLRRNGGGFLPEAVEVAGLFIDVGPVVQVKGYGRRIRVLNDEEAGSVWRGPLVVLTSRLSASASEIVAGVIKDYRRGLIVGDATTHGKGTVQRTVDLVRDTNYKAAPGALGFLKLTFQQFYTPDGASTQLEGVPADVEMPSWTGVMDVGEADLPNALPFARIGPVKHEDLSLVDGDLVTTVRDLSLVRRASSAYFKNLAQRLGAYLEFKRRKTIPLEEKAYKALQSQLDGESAVDELAQSDKPDTKNPWFVEVLDITVDYIRLLRSRAR